MKLLASKLLTIFIASAFAGACLASSDATCLIYQPIDMRSEGSVIKLPKEGFIILAVPYLSAFTVSEKPYHAITRSYAMLSMRRNQAGWDANVVSRTGIKIQSNCTFDGNKVKDEVVTVDLENFQAKDYDQSLGVIVEATLECIRLTAMHERQQWRRPILKIIGKPSDKAKWKRWEDKFNKQDFSKPFKRPQAIQDKGE